MMKSVREILINKAIRMNETFCDNIPTKSYVTAYNKVKIPVSNQIYYRIQDEIRIRMS